MIRLVEKEDGCCEVGFGRRKKDVLGATRGKGVPEARVTEAMASLNSGEAFHFPTPAGPYKLLIDPTNHDIIVRWG